MTISEQAIDIYTMGFLLHVHSTTADFCGDCACRMLC